jgi:hypothetical protein
MSTTQPDRRKQLSYFNIFIALPTYLDLIILAWISFIGIFLPPLPLLRILTSPADSHHIGTKRAHDAPHSPPCQI